MGQFVDLESARSRLSQIDAEREPLLALIRAAEAYESVVGRGLFATSYDVRDGRLRSFPTGGRAAPVMAATEAAVADVLEAIGPTSTSDLVELLVGHAALNLPQDKGSVNLLSARLSANSRFQSRRGVGWWFSDKPWPSDTPAAQLAEDTDQSYRSMDP